MNKVTVSAPLLSSLWFVAGHSLLFSQTLSFLRPLPNPISLETSTSVAAAGSGVYVTGVMWPAAGGAYGFSTDAFLRKYDSTGAQVWEHTFGGPVTPVAVKTSNAALYVAGHTGWNFPAQKYYVLPGQEGKGFTEVFLRRYDSDGKEVWTRQFGGEGADAARSVAVDSTGVYVAGNFGALIGPGQPFLRKFDLNGNELWTQSLNFVATVAADGVGVYVTGSIAPLGDRKQWAGFISRYDTSGSLVWTQQFDFEAFTAAIAATGGGVYVSGSTPVPGNAFLRRYDASGSVVWTPPFCSTRYCSCRG